MPNLLPAEVLMNNWRTALIKKAQSSAGENMYFRKNIGLMNLLMSPANRQASIFDLTDIQFTNGNGKYKTAGISFRELVGPDFSSDNKWLHSDEFDDAEDAFPKFHQFEMQLFAKSKTLKLSNDVLNQINENATDWFTPQMEEHLRNFLIKIANLVSNRVMTGGYIGKFPKVQPDMPEELRKPFKALPLFENDGKSVNYMGEILLEHDMQNLSYLGGGFKVGSNRLGMYRKLLEYTSLADLSLSAGTREVIGTWNEDIGVTTYGSAYGAGSPMLVFVPGSLQVVAFSHRVGDFVIDEPDHKAIQFIEPYFGLPLTMVWKRELVRGTGTNPDEYVTKIRYQLDGFDVIGLKNIKYTDNYVFDGVNGVVAYDIVKGDLTVDDIMEWKNPTMGLGYKEQDLRSTYESATVSIMAAARHSYNGDGDLLINPTVSEASTGATLAQYAYEIGGTTIAFGNAEDDITGVTGVSGTYAAPVFDLAEFEGAAKVKVSVKDSANNEASTFVFL